VSQSALNYIAIQLASQLNDPTGTGFSAKAVGESVAVDKAGATFTVVDTTQTTSAALTDVITLGTSGGAGSAAAGEFWQVNLLDGSGHVVKSAFRDITASTSLSTLATNLATDLTGSGFNATAANGTITISGTSAFTAQIAPVSRSVSAFASAAEEIAVTPAVTGNNYSGSVQIGTPAIPVAGTVWTIVVNDGSNTKSVRYTWAEPKPGRRAILWQAHSKRRWEARLRLGFTPIPRPCRRILYPLRPLMGPV
jgi:hypothetical protein